MSLQSVSSAQHCELRRAVKGLISVGERLLVVRETHDDGSPFWTLPGGGVESGESDTEALEREIAEELRCHVEVGERQTSVWYAHSSAERLSQYVVYDCTLHSRPRPNPVEGIRGCRLVRPSGLESCTLQQVRYVIDNVP